MSRLPPRIAWLLIVGGLLGVDRPAWAEEALSPLATMRAAAEEQAETLPVLPPNSASAGLPKTRAGFASPPIQGAAADALQTELRKAAQAEVAHEMAAHPQQGPGSAAAAGKSVGASTGKEAREDAHEAAVQAQSAKLIGVQHRQGLAKGQEKSAMRDSLSPARAAGNGTPRAK